MRSESFSFSSRRSEWWNAVRLVFTSDDFAGVVLYRIRMWLDDARVPILPWILHRACIALFGIRIGREVVIAEGLYLLHGNVVIDGVVEIGGGCSVGPYTTIGLKQGNLAGPTIEGNVFIGTGARVIGDVRIGANANIGAGAVVLHDVPAGVTVAGVPARVIEAAP